MSRIRRSDIHGLRFEDMIYQRGHSLAAPVGAMSDEDTISGVLTRSGGQHLRFNADYFYDWFSEKSNRVELKRHISQNIQADMPVQKNMVLDTGKLNYQHYSKTFEWYISEILVRELRFIKSGFHILLDGAPDGGDYDALGFSANELVYVEAKSGRPTNVALQDLKAFVDRARFLNSTVSIVYVDFEGIEEHFSFRDFAKAADSSTIYRIADRRSKARVYRPEGENIYILENQGGGDVVKNLRFLFRTHYATQAGIRNQLKFHQAILKPDEYEVTWLH